MALFGKPYCKMGLSILLFLAFNPLVFAETKTFPVEGLKAGMKGVGYSVFSGTKVEPFDVKILSVVEDNFGKEKLILVQLSGDRLKRNGGLSAGMSGSPVYIKNRLLGAISYGFENADSFLALVTPIQSMLKLVPAVRPTAALKGLPFRPVPVITPVLVSGMGRRGYELVEGAIAGYGLKPVFLAKSNGGLPPARTNDPIRPGSAIAVQLVSGDYQVMAIGTVTMVNKNQFLAFGHSFTNKGDVDLLVLQAYIIHTVKSPVMSFKIGIPIQPVGRVTQDRQAGLLGQLGEAPVMIPVTVAVNDLDRNISRNSNFQVVNNEQVYRDLICSGVTDAIDQTIDRMGSGTAIVKVRIETAANPEGIVRENQYYGKDIAMACLSDLRNLMEILAVNEFSRSEIRSVQVEVKVKARQETARIVKIESEKRKFKPGESVKLKVSLHTFRGDNIGIPLEIKLPANAEPGKISLMCFGGSKDAGLEENNSGKKETFKIDYKDTDSLQKLVANYLNSPANNQVVLEYQVNTPKSDAAAEEDRDLHPEQIKSVTPYYILGEAQLTIEIIPG